MAAVHEVTTIGQIDDATIASANGPVLIFKHSLTCGRSAWAQDEVINFCRVGAVSDLVPIQVQPAVSRVIETRFRVRHESPQVVILRDGKVMWSAAHHRVTKVALEKRCRELREPPG